MTDQTPEDRTSEDVRAAEASNKPVTVEWEGMTFVVPRSYDEWPVELLVALEDDRAAGIVRGALGPAQWSQFMATRPKIKQLAELSTKIARALGFASAGESETSSA